VIGFGHEHDALVQTRFKLGDQFGSDPAVKRGVLRARTEVTASNGRIT